MTFLPDCIKTSALKLKLGKKGQAVSNIISENKTPTNLPVH